MPNLTQPEKCFICGESALGVARNGRQYCHRRTCIDWKLERWESHLERERIKAAILALFARRRARV
jgi:hypothetical protein